MSLSIYNDSGAEIPFITCARCRQDCENINSHYGVMFCDECMLTMGQTIAALSGPRLYKAWTCACGSINTFAVRYGADTELRNADDLREILANNKCTECLRIKE